MQLTKRIYDKNQELYFDQYFSTYYLFQIHAKNCIFGVGTVRMNRFSNLPRLPSDKELRANWKLKRLF